MENIQANDFSVAVHLNEWNIPAAITVINWQLNTNTKWGKKLRGGWPNNLSIVVVSHLRSVLFWVGNFMHFDTYLTIKCPRKEDVDWLQICWWLASTSTVKQLGCSRSGMYIRASPEKYGASLASLVSWASKISIKRAEIEISRH